MSSVLQLSVMKRRGLVLLLLSGCVSVCRLQTDRLIRCFHAVNLKKTWTEAQSYCRDKFTDLATIQGPTNNAEAQQAAGSGTFWIGLYNSTWTWSQESQDIQVDTWFSKWAANEPRAGGCVIISDRGDWFVRDCGAQQPSVCYSAAANQHILEKQPMTWSEAQTHCRSKYTDLSSIRTQEDNDQVASLLQTVTDPVGSTEAASFVGQTYDGDQLFSAPPAAWIGLHRHFWVWSDRSGASYRNWALRQPDAEADCAMMDASSSSGVWYFQPCGEKSSFLCYTDTRASVLRSVRVRLSGGSADLNDPVLQDSILQQLKQKLEERGIGEEVKLRWSRQPGGSVFHREEEDEGAPPGDWGEEGVCVG
ncbi:macrophage mannose receptor 1-like isoform X2 [Toxotes jaculatrix]|uniref:macrophage mannose receptor 1-like isoform X2 n=1 Tax=Toxotes jaculatrix TaxID=941984 RepID=UPI001B3AC53C|nr:macrophage mannose receptor 1-like isoform X2 [Toxotes jaculatrix]